MREKIRNPDQTRLSGSLVEHSHLGLMMFAVAETGDSVHSPHVHGIDSNISLPDLFTALSRDDSVIVDLALRYARRERVNFGSRVPLQKVPCDLRRYLQSRRLMDGRHEDPTCSSRPSPEIIAPRAPPRSCLLLQNELAQTNEVLVEARGSRRLERLLVARGIRASP